MSKDKFAIDNLIIFVIVICLFLLFLNLYYTFYTDLHTLGLTNIYVNKFIAKVLQGFPLLKNTLTSHFMIICFYMIASFGISFKKKPEDDSALKKYTLFASISFFVFTICALLNLGLYLNTGLSIISLIVFIWSFSHVRKHFNFFSNQDEFNHKNLEFQQEKIYRENEYSVNLKTQNGLINVVNPFRATMVLGTPGSGKSYSVIEEYIRQHLMKNFSMMVYDFKFPSLAKETYAFYEYYKKTYKKEPRFTVISLDDIMHSNFVNPISPDLINKTADAIEASQTVLYNLNKEWITKKDFFAQSAIAYFACCIYYLKLYENGKFCTLPHAIALASSPDEKIFKIFKERRELRFFMTPFADALEKEAYEQLSGQTATARIPLSQLATRELFWVMGNNVFPDINASLNINSLEDPQIMILANSPSTQTTNSPALGLITSQLIKEVNKQNKLPCSIIIDELPTMYFMGLDNLIATARSNKVSTTIGAQDLEQLKRDYGDKVAETIFNIIGNVFSGSVRSGTATKLQEMFGKKKQRLKNMTVDTSTTSYSINESMDFAIPVSTISQLSQGEFVGVVADNFGEEIKQKVFRGHIKVDKRTDQVKKDIPLAIDEDNMEELLDGNFKRITDEIDIIIVNELYKIDEQESSQETNSESNTDESNTDESNTDESNTEGEAQEELSDTSGDQAEQGIENSQAEASLSKANATVEEKEELPETSGNQIEQGIENSQAEASLSKANPTVEEKEELPETLSGGQSEGIENSQAEASLSKANATVEEKEELPETSSGGQSEGIENPQGKAHQDKANTTVEEKEELPETSSGGQSEGIENPQGETFMHSANGEKEEEIRDNTPNDQAKQKIENPYNEAYLVEANSEKIVPEQLRKQVIQKLENRQDNSVKETPEKPKEKKKNSAKSNNG